MEKNKGLVDTDPTWDSKNIYSLKWKEDIFEIHMDEIFGEGNWVVIGYDEKVPYDTVANKYRVRLGPGGHITFVSPRTWN